MGSKLVIADHSAHTTGYAIVDFRVTKQRVRKIFKQLAELNARDFS